MKIRAAVTRAPKAPALLEELRLEDPRPNEILVRIVATGVCHGDIVARDQVYPVRKEKVSFASFLRIFLGTCSNR